MAFQAGQRLTAADLNAALGLAVIKGADQSLLNNSSLQDDNALILALTAGAAYDFTAYLNYEGAATGAGDLKFNWLVPSGANLRYTYHCSSTSGLAPLTGVTATAATIVNAGSNGAGTLMGADMTGTLIVGSSAGNLQLQWAQATANASVATIVHAQSKVRLVRVS